MSLHYQNSGKPFQYFFHWLYTESLDGFFCPKSTKPTVEQVKAVMKQEKKAVPDLKAKKGATSEKTVLESTSENVITAELALGFIVLRDFPFDKAVELYMLADVLQIKGLKDQNVTKLVTVYTGRPLVEAVGHFWGQRDNIERPVWMPDPTSSINLACEILPEASHLRRLLLTLFCDNIRDPSPKAGEEALNYNFIVKAYTEMMNLFEDDSYMPEWTEKARFADITSMVSNVHWKWQEI